MAISNKAAGAKAGHAKRKGGARRGAGRPLGSPDRGPRKGTVSEDDRFLALQADYGKVCKQRDDLLRQVDDLRFQLNYGKAYPGDSKALLTATYKAEYYPSQEQLYAAKLMLDREYPLDTPGEPQIDEIGKVVLWLPNNRRDPNLENDPDRDWINERLDHQWEAERQQRNEELRQWIKDGKLCEDCAVLCRSQWQEADDPQWERMTPVNPPMQYIPAPAQYRSEPLAPVAAPANGEDTGELPPQWKDMGAKAGAVTVLFTEPFRGFQVGSGRRYEADERGEVIVDEADPDDRADLVKMGCREGR